MHFFFQCKIGKEKKIQRSFVRKLLDKVIFSKISTVSSNPIITDGCKYLDKNHQSHFLKHEIMNLTWTYGI